MPGYTLKDLKESALHMETVETLDRYFYSLLYLFLENVNHCK